MIKDIIKGHINELLSKEEELKEERMAICRKCGLFLDSAPIGPICNNKRFIDPITGNTSNSMKVGYIKGCGCRLNAKTRLKDNSCIIGLW